MLRKLGLCLSFVSLLFLSHTVRANLLELDLNIAGDGLITYDTTTDLQWLDLSQTAGWATNDLIGEFDTGGSFEGWRYATTLEWDHLAREASLTPSVVPHFPGDFGLTYTVADLQTMLYLIGAPGYSGETINYVSHASVGETHDDFHGPSPSSFPDSDWNITPDLTFTPQGALYVGSYDDTWNPAFSNPSGHYLVRTSVPEPASLILFSLGLVGLGFVRRKKLNNG